MTTPRLKTLLSILLCAPLIVAAQEAPATSNASLNDENEDIVVLSVFEVTADADRGYSATSAVSGTRLNTNLLELPKSVDVVTSEFIRDIGAVDMAQALQYSAGVILAENDSAADAFGGRFSIRGIQTDTSYRNGFPSSFIVDPILLDRIEIIKGPSSTFSGPIEPGGTRNYITRKPPAKQSTSVYARHESYNRFRAQIVNGGPITRDKALSYRIAGVYENMKHVQDFGKRERYVVAGTLLWKINPKATLQNDFQFIRSKVKPSAYTAYIHQRPPGTLATDPYFYVRDVADSFNRMGPNGYVNTDQVSSLTDFTYRLNSTWTFRVGLMYTYQNQERLMPGLGTQLVLANPNTGAADWTNGKRAISLTEVTYMPNAISFAINPQAYAVGQFKYGTIDHKLMLGADFYCFDSKNDIYRWSTPTPYPRIYVDSDAYNSGGQFVNDISWNFGDTEDRTKYREFNLRRTLSRHKSLSINNVFQLFGRRLTLLQALRYTHVDDINKNLMTSAVNPRAQSTYSNWVQSYGLSYKIFPKLSAFVSYSQSFNPQFMSLTYEGNILDPLKGEGWDVGFKYDIFKDKITGTLTAYDLKQSNASIGDPDHSGYNISSGAQKSKGIELSLHANLVKNWKLTLGYSFIDAEMTKVYNNLADRLGRVANIPKHQLTLWNHYRISSGSLKGLSAGLGIVYMSNRRTHATLRDDPGLEAAGYTKIDANISYTRKLWDIPVTFRVDVSNLTDKKYFSSYNYYGMPRTYAGSIEIRF